MGEVPLYFNPIPSSGESTPRTAVIYQPRIVATTRLLARGGPFPDQRPHTFRGTSLIINTVFQGPYSRTTPRVLWWS